MRRHHGGRPVSSRRVRRSRALRDLWNARYWEAFDSRCDWVRSRVRSITHCGKPLAIIYGDWSTRVCVVCLVPVLADVDVLFWRATDWQAEVRAAGGTFPEDREEGTR